MQTICSIPIMFGPFRLSDIIVAVLGIIAVVLFCLVATYIADNNRAERSRRNHHSNYRNDHIGRG